MLNPGINSLYLFLAAIFGLSDLHQFDPALKSWRKLDPENSPSARVRPGFAGVMAGSESQLYAFGGFSVLGEQD
jgi:hypothetical protein